MKKTIGILLSLALVIGSAGCGNSTGTEQEATKQEEAKEEETQGSDYSDLMGKEFENDDIYIKIENTEQLVGLDDEWEQQKQEEADAPYVEIYEKAGYDKDKEYTIDEYMEILTKICEEMGKENNIELAQMSPFDSYDGFRIETTVGITEFTEETTKRLMNYIEYGRDGWGGITEFCIVKGKSDDGEESVMIFTKLDNEVIEKNMREWQ